MELRSGTVVRPEPPSAALSQEGLAFFQQGVSLLLGRWTALQLAIHNEWGGPSSQQKAQQMQAEIVAWLTHSKVQRYIDELENMLDENMIVLFNTETEDGSLEEVAEKIMSLYEDCANGNFTTVRDLMSSGPATSHSASVSQQVVDIEEETPTGNVEGPEADTDMDIDNSLQKKDPFLSKAEEDRKQALAMEEADGWQLVKSSKSKRKSGRT